MKNNKINKMSENELSEILSMMYEINKLVRNTYIHVSDNIPSNIQKELDAFHASLIREKDRREDLF